MEKYLYREVNPSELGVRGERVANVNYCSEFYNDGDYFAIFERKSLVKLSAVEFLNDGDCKYAVYQKSNRTLICLIGDAEMACTLSDYSDFDRLRAKLYRDMALAAGWPETLPYGIGNLSESNPTLESFVSICTQLGIPWEVAAYDDEGEVVFRAQSSGAYIDTLLEYHAMNYPEITFAYMNDGVAIAHINFIDETE